MKTKRLAAGYYEVIGTDGFQVVKTEDGMWVWVNGKNHSEGGHDRYYTKYEALEALSDYLARRTYHPVYGWCMGS